LVVGVAVLATAFVRLGDWQLNRLDQRRDRNASAVANEAAPVRPYADVFTRPIAEADQWQRVSAQGTFDAERQFVVRYRSNGEEANGYEVVTPLRTATGTVLVDRGFVSLPRGTKIPPVAPPPPSGEVTLVGHVRRSEQGRRGAIQPADGQIRLINSDALAGALPYPIADGFIGLLTVDPPQEGGFKPVLLPEISEGPHFWYAIQWFMFAALGLSGIVVFIRSDLRARRRESTAPEVRAPRRTPSRTPSPH
jgi:cytochrome oxidase assembly protein ShyY1